MLATGSRDKSAFLWDIQRGDVVHAFDQSCSVTSVSINHASTLVGVGQLRGVVKIYDTVSSKRMKRLDHHSSAIVWLEFNCDDSQLLCVGADCGVSIVTRSSDNEWILAAYFENSHHNRSAACFSGDGRLVYAAISSHIIEVYHSTNEENKKSHLQQFGQQQGMIACLVHATVAHRMASCDSDGNVIIWNTHVQPPPRPVVAKSPIAPVVARTHSNGHNSSAKSSPSSSPSKPGARGARGHRIDPAAVSTAAEAMGKLGLSLADSAKDISPHSPSQFFDMNSPAKSEAPKASAGNQSSHAASVAAELLLASQSPSHSPVHSPGRSHSPQRFHSTAPAHAHAHAHANAYGSAVIVTSFTDPRRISIDCLRLTHDGSKCTISSSQDSVINVWNATTGDFLMFINVDSAVCTHVLRPRGCRLAAAADQGGASDVLAAACIDGGVFEHLLETGQCVGAFEGHERAATCVSYGLSPLK